MTTRPRAGALISRWLLVLLAAALSVLLPGAAWAAPRAAVVVLPTGATAGEQFAAAELQRGLQAVGGWEVQIMAAAPAPTAGGLTFWVGTVETPARLAALPAGRVAAKAEGLSEDGVCLQGEGKDIVLVGKGRRGALNAVYTFLEQCVGFHWPEPGQEFVPPPAPLALDRLDLVSNPAFAYRGVAIHGTCSADWFAQILDWLSKNRMNAFQLFPGHYEQVRPTVLQEVLKRGLYLNIGGHSREFFFPHEKAFAQHPDWFALVKGQRVADTQICYSNLESVPEYAANVVAYLKTRPEIGMASLWPSDGYGFCECERCKAGQVADTILTYCNAVTAEIVKALPEVKTEFLSYIHYTAPPREVRPLPAVVPTYCEYWSRSQFHPITDERNGNAQCRAQMEGWIAASRQVTLFSYYGDDCIKRFVYNPLMDMIGADLRYYRSIRLAGNFVLLTNPQSWWSHAPHLYAYARAAWDPDTPLATLETDYYDSLYGAAAGALREHAAASRALFDLQTAQGGSGEDLLWGQSYTCTDPALIAQTRTQGLAAVARVRACLQSARATGPRPDVLARLAKLEADADYLAWLFDVAAAAQEVPLDPTPAAKQRLLELATRGLQLEIIAEDDRAGYRSARNTLLDITRRLTGQEPALTHGTPAQLREYAQDGIWRWTTADVVPSTLEKPRRLQVEVTPRLKGPGTYQVIWQYLDGADGLSILSTGLYSATVADPKPEELVAVAIDAHEAFTGGGNSKNVYTLALTVHDPARRYFIVGSFYDQREFDTFGHVLLRAE